MLVPKFWRSYITKIVFGRLKEKGRYCCLHNVDNYEKVSSDGAAINNAILTQEKILVEIARRNSESNAREKAKKERKTRFFNWFFV